MSKNLRTENTIQLLIELGVSPNDIREIAESAQAGLGKTMISPDGQLYGYENSVSSRSVLDGLVDRFIKTAVQATSHRPKILDVGGGTGHRAEQFARQGADVLVTGLSDCEDEVLARNHSIGRPALRYKLQDIRDAQPTELRDNWDLVHMRHLLHWLPEEGVIKVLDFLPQISGRFTFVAASLLSMPLGIEHYERSNSRRAADNFYNHQFKRVHSLMTERGYKLHHATTSPTDIPIILNCEYFAQVPQPR